MKASELRNLSAREILEKVNGFEEELFNLRFQARMGQLSNALQLRMLHRDIARARTILREKRDEKSVTKAPAKAPA